MNLASPIRFSVRQTLLEKIRTGDLAEGDVVSPPALAATLGVSATPVREALLDLAQEGFVDNVARRGFFVRALHAEEVEEIYPLIWTIEGMALRDAPPHQADLVALDALNEAFEAASDPLACVDADRAWHARLIGRCRKHAWITLLATLKERASRYEAEYMRASGAMPQSVSHHRLIAQALRAGDLDAAVTALHANWQVGPQFLLPWIAGRSRGAAR